MITGTTEDHPQRIDAEGTDAEGADAPPETPSRGRRKTKKKRGSASAKSRRRDLLRALEAEREERRRIERKLSKANAVPERGIETWFRLASRNLYTRRQIVDSKAQIAITVNSVVLSVVLGSVYNRLQEDPHLAIAIVPLVLANLISITFGIVATRPRNLSGSFDWRDVETHRANLMTFDDFHRMPLDAYERAVDAMMESRDFLYGTMKREIHSVGVDLARRYRWVGRSYVTFLFGVVVATVLFGLCHALY
jgi:hypothetical protein